MNYASPCAAHCTCGCCSATDLRTPRLIDNRPGLRDIAYRVGSFADFKASMFEMLGRPSALFPELDHPLEASASQSQRDAYAQLQAMVTSLRSLTTRDDTDFAVALLDAWAIIADVLTFYQERLAHESYLPTATQRDSVQFLARLIGYELRPALAAKTHLAFDIDEAAGSPAEVSIPTGTRVQSVPLKDEPPHPYETDAPILARPEWNSLRPRLKVPQSLSRDADFLLLKGLALSIQPGDRLLLAPNGTEDGAGLRIVHRVVELAAEQATRVDLVQSPSRSVPLDRVHIPLANFSTAITPLARPALEGITRGLSWSQPDFEAQAALSRWTLAKIRNNLARPQRAAPTTGPAGVFSFQHRAGVFGGNAPAYDSLPLPAGSTKSVAYGPDWDSPAATLSSSSTANLTIDLDGVYSPIAPDSWVVISSGDSLTGPPSATLMFRRAASAIDLSRRGFTLAQRVTRLTLDAFSGLHDLSIRSVAILAGSRPHELAELALTEPIQGDEIVLDRAYFGLGPGQTVILTGERDDLQGVVESEVRVLAEVRLEDLRTVLRFTEPLRSAYVRATVRINANVAPATQGETRIDAIASGDGSARFLRAVLREPPLVHVAASSPRGMAPHLEVRVGGVLWSEVPTLFDQAPDARVYTLRSNADGSSVIQFGDGIEGARPPTGFENITATYRKGGGLAALVRAGQLTLLARRPLGVRAVTNPIASGSAADPERLQDARRIAPRSILTLDRIVSLADYGNFAHAYPGIAKAKAVWVWSHAHRGVHITVSPQSASVFVPDAPEPGHDDALLAALRGTIAKVADPAIPVRVVQHRTSYFRVRARLRTHPAHVQSEVILHAEHALRAHFSFSSRDLAQGVARSEVIAILQRVPGVTYVDLDAFFRTGEPESLQESILARATTSGANDADAAPAELLLLDPRRPDLEGLA